jgi:hypothetical protein
MHCVTIELSRPASSDQIRFASCHVGWMDNIDYDLVEETTTNQKHIGVTRVGQHSFSAAMAIPQINQLYSLEITWYTLTNWLVGETDSRKTEMFTLIDAVQIPELSGPLANGGGWPAICCEYTNSQLVSSACVRETSPNSLVSGNW